VDKKKKEAVSFQEGAGGLLLMAAAKETGLLSHLQAAIGSPSDAAWSPVSDQESGQDAHPEQAEVLRWAGESRQQKSQRKQVATLLFLSAVGLRRPWDLRSYSGDALGLLVGRKRAYSYSHTEQFLATLANTDAADRLTDALGRWTSHVWHTALDQLDDCYVDGHHKPQYISLKPKRVKGKTGKPQIWHDTRK
jgi:hypothetical protein